MKNQPNQAKPPIDEAFLNILREHKKGAAISDVSAAIKTVCAAIQTTGKPGKVILEIDLKPVSNGDVGTMAFQHKVKTKLPEASQAATIFYADEDFGLRRDDPQQSTLPLREATPEAAPVELREVEGK
jgi:hypothetical protein